MAQFVRGSITDAATGARVSSANVRLYTVAGRLMFGMLADKTGDFRIPVPTRDTVMVEVDRIGYAPVISKPFALRPGEQLEVDVMLVLQAVALQPMKVIGHKIVDARLSEFYNRATENQRIGRGKVWTRADLESHPVPFLSHLLRMIPTRPAMGCEGNAVFVDRLRIFSDAGNPSIDWSDLDMMVSPEDVEGVEFYRAPDIPPDYDQMFCQIILIWRKPYGEGGHPFKWANVFFAVFLVGLTLLEQKIY